jgi:hypothetical protein
MPCHGGVPDNISHMIIAILQPTGKMYDLSVSCDDCKDIMQHTHLFIARICVTNARHDGTLFYYHSANLGAEDTHNGVFGNAGKWHASAVQYL